MTVRAARRCSQLEWLELRACGRLSDSGIKHIGLLAARQTKACAQWAEVREQIEERPLTNPPNQKKTPKMKPQPQQNPSNHEHCPQARNKWAEAREPIGDPPPALTHLDLGGLGRLSDTGAQVLPLVLFSDCVSPVSVLLPVLSSTHPLTHPQSPRAGEAPLPRDPLAIARPARMRAADGGGPIASAGAPKFNTEPSK